MSFQFVKSASCLAECPKDFRPEIALIGRSNAGKSSLVNTLANSRIAKVSQVPGKTRLLNFFSWNKVFYLADLPGYGFAKRSGKERVSWQKMIEDYLLYRENLRVFVLIMDIRRDWTEDEESLIRLFESRGAKMAVILNKTDKIGGNLKRETIKKMRASMPDIEFFLLSNKSKEGLQEIKKWMLHSLEAEL